MRIAHLSDLHFAQMSFNPSQIFSKEWLGNLNLLLRRSKTYCNERPFKLIPFLKELGIEMCLITGDVSTTSNLAEFKMAKRFTDALEKEGIGWFTIPGNHDCYTKSAEREKRFYQTFPTKWQESEYSLTENRLTMGPLCHGWHLIALDTTLATSLISSEGLFPESLEPTLNEALGKIPEGEKVLMMNHFPFSQHESQRRRMLRGQNLQTLLENTHNVEIYLHGHTHRLCLADLRPSNLPIVLDSGSAAHHALSSFNVLDLQPNACHVMVYHINQSDWHKIQEEDFTWTNGIKTD